MKFNATAGAMRQALSRSRSAIVARPTLIAHSGALITAVKGSNKAVRITGSNDQLTVLSSVTGAKVEENGSILVNPAPVQGFLSTLAEETPLEVESTDTHLVITRQGAVPYRFVPMHADFPDPPTVRGTKASVNFNRLADAVDAVRRSTGEDAIVELRSDNDHLTLASTDNFRLSQARLINAGFGDYTGILQLTALDRIAKANPMAVNFEKRAINAVTEDVSITVRAMTDASFPDVNTALNQTPKHQVTLSTADFTKALQRLHAVDSDATVAIGIDQNSMTISLAESPAGNGEEEVQISGGPTTLFTVSVNLKYLLDTAVSHKSEELSLGFSGPTDILFIRSADNELQTTSAVMPVVAPNT